MEFRLGNQTGVEGRLAPLLGEFLGDWDKILYEIEGQQAEVDQGLDRGLEVRKSGDDSPHLLC